MRTLVFTPVTFNLAETTRMIEIARAMGAGWRCVFAVYEPDHVHWIEQAGFEVHQLGPVFTKQEAAQALALDQGRSLNHPFSVDLVRRRVEAERNLIREVRAEAVVMGTNVTSLLSARAEGVPLFYAVPFALTRPHVEQAKRIGLIRGDGVLARAGDRLATSLFKWVYGRLPWVPKAFRVVGPEVGVAPPTSPVSLFEGDVNLLTVMPSELHGFDLPDGYHRVGPIFARLPGEVPDVVRELAASETPLVYLALGSSGNRRLALAAARALGELDVHVVAPVRAFVESRDVLPDNVHLVDLLPAHRLGGLVDAAVLHGGQGTVQTACATGVPFVGMGLQPEQTWNVDVCVKSGNAVALSPRDVTKPVFREAVERVIHDPRMRVAAERVQEQFAGEDGAAASARVIEELLGQTFETP